MTLKGIYLLISNKIQSYIYSRLKVCPTIDDLQCPDGSTTHANKDKAEVLNNFSTSSYIHSRKFIFNSVLYFRYYSASLTNCNCFTSLIVYKKLLDINPRKSPGPKGWPLLAFKETAWQVCTPLSVLFVKSLETCTHDWKSAHVTPIFKKGNHHLHTKQLSTNNFDLYS